MIKRKFWQLEPKTISNLIVVLIGILFYVCLSNFGVIRSYVDAFYKVVEPFVVGFIIAFLLNSPVRFFENKVFHRLRWKRGLSITAVYLLAVVVVAVLLQMILPQVAFSVVALMNNLQGYLDNLNALVDALVARFELEGEGIDAFMVSYEDLVKQAAGLISSVLPELLNIGVAVGNGVITAITALISSVYMLSGRNKLKVQLKSFLFAVFSKEKTERFLQICRRSNDIFVGFINGKIIDSAIIGVLCFVLCLILQIPYHLLISVIVGVTNIIPFFGPFVGAIPSAMILLIVDPWAAVRFVVMILALQQFDGNILGPKILGNSTGISAIWVLVAIVVGGGLFGFPGMLLGVPTFAVIYMLSREFVYARLAEKGIDGEGRPLSPAEDGQKEESEAVK